MRRSNIVLMEETSGGVIEAGTSEAIEAVEANSVKLEEFCFTKYFLPFFCKALVIAFH